MILSLTLALIQHLNLEWKVHASIGERGWFFYSYLTLGLTQA